MIWIYTRIPLQFYVDWPPQSPVFFANEMHEHKCQIVSKHYTLEFRMLPPWHPKMKMKSKVEDKWCNLQIMFQKINPKNITCCKKWKLLQVYVWLILTLWQGFIIHLVGLFGILQSSTHDGTKWHDTHIKVVSPMSQMDILGTRYQTLNIANPTILVKIWIGLGWHGVEDTLV